MNRTPFIWLSGRKFKKPRTAAGWKSFCPGRRPPGSPAYGCAPPPHRSWPVRTAAQAVVIAHDAFDHPRRSGPPWRPRSWISSSRLEKNCPGYRRARRPPSGGTWDRYNRPHLKADTRCCSFKSSRRAQVMRVFPWPLFSAATINLGNCTFSITGPPFRKTPRSRLDWPPASDDCFLLFSTGRLLP